MTTAASQCEVIAVARIFKEIPRSCSCGDGWQSPDYRRPPGQRGWILTKADPQCRLHGAQSGERT
jgi:hypothetical protein